MEAMDVLWSVWCYVFGYYFRFLQTAVYLLLKQFIGSKQGVLDPIKNNLLLEPATVLADKIRTGKLKSETLVKAYIDRIRIVNPHLNAVVEDRFKDALQDAREADNYVLTSGKTPEALALEKPFLGVPFTAKDSVAVKGLDLTTGVIALKGTKAKEDCPVVANMRASGAIPLCVTNVPELCMWGDASNKLFGITNNAYDLTRVPGGSSGGEGALITSCGSVIGIGNDIGGSVRIPSFCSGVFGHKTSKRVLSNKGQFPSSYETDLDEYNVTGPICRYAADLIPMLKVLGGENIKKLKLDTKVDLKNIKVYYTEDYIDQALTTRMDPELKECVRKVVRHLESTYGIKAKKVSIPLLNSACDMWMAKLFTANVPPFTDLATEKPGQFNIYLEFLKWILRRCNHGIYFLHMAVVDIIYRSSWKAESNKKSKELFNQFANQFKDILGEDGVFIIPPSATTAPYYQEQSLKLFNYAYTGIFNALGYPVTQCPLGLSSERLPLGVQVVANLHNDHLTLAVAKDIEQKFGGWNPPCPISI